MLTKHKNTMPATTKKKKLRLQHSEHRAMRKNSHCTSMKHEKVAKDAEHLTGKYAYELPTERIENTGEQ